VWNYKQLTSSPRNKFYVTRKQNLCSVVPSSCSLLKLYVNLQIPPNKRYLFSVVSANGVLALIKKMKIFTRPTNFLNRYA